MFCDSTSASHAYSVFLPGSASVILQFLLFILLSVGQWFVCKGGGGGRNKLFIQLWIFCGVQLASSATLNLSSIYNLTIEGDGLIRFIVCKIVMLHSYAGVLLAHDFPSHNPFSDLFKHVMMWPYSDIVECVMMCLTSTIFRRVTPTFHDIHQISHTPTHSLIPAWFLLQQSFDTWYPCICTQSLYHDLMHLVKTWNLKSNGLTIEIICQKLIIIIQWTGNKLVTMYMLYWDNVW